MSYFQTWICQSPPSSSSSSSSSSGGGGLFLDPSTPANFVAFFVSSSAESKGPGLKSRPLRQSFVVMDADRGEMRGRRRRRKVSGSGFMSMSVTFGESEGKEGRLLDDVQKEEEEEEEEEKAPGKAAMNTTKHLWAGAVSAMVSRTFVAPLERLKLEYMIRGEQRNLLTVIRSIANSQGLIGFWRGNFVNILRTAPFKAINFYAYDAYSKYLVKISGKEESTNNERFIAGAAAGITAAILCIPMDTIRTRMVAPGGEALGGVIGVFSHMVRTEGIFSLYKGLVPSLISMAPSGAVFYGVYDILKSAYLHSPQGMRRRLMMAEQHEGKKLNALDQLELSPTMTLLYGAISGCCAEAATYPFEVVRRQLQMQVQSNKLNAFATCVKIVEQGGVSALYAGLLPSLLQVLPSASISYFVYEFMKVLLKVE